MLVQAEDRHKSEFVGIYIFYINLFLCIFYFIRLKLEAVSGSCLVS